MGAECHGRKNGIRPARWCQRSDVGGVVKRVGEGAWAAEMQGMEADSDGEDSDGGVAGQSSQRQDTGGKVGEDNGNTDEDIEERRAAIAKQRQRVEITFGMRTGDLPGVVHGARWARCAAGEQQLGRHTRDGRRGCPAGCGVPCTLKHVVLGQCIACEAEEDGEKSALRRILAGLAHMNEEMVRVWKRGRKRAGVDTQARWAAGGETWRREVRLAKTAVATAIGNPAGGVRPEAWAVECEA